MSDGIALLSGTPRRSKDLSQWDLSTWLTPVVIWSFDKEAATVDVAIDVRLRHGEVALLTAQRLSGQAVSSKEQRQ